MLYTAFHYGQSKKKWIFVVLNVWRNGRLALASLVSKPSEKHCMPDYLFSSDKDPLAGFDCFWSLYPRDRRRPGRKAGRSLCVKVWKRDKLHKIHEQVNQALMEDVKQIKAGAYALGEDMMYYFCGIQPWLNQRKWDRDLKEEVESSKAVVDEVVIPKPPPPPEQPPMTNQEKAAMLHVWRAIATGKAKPWPRRG